MYITEDICDVGVDDRTADLFEGQYRLKNGMSYHSYVILDEKIAVMDTVDARFTEEWIAKLSHVLAGRTPDYLIVQHMEPDHSAGIRLFAETYPHARIVSSERSFGMMKNFFGTDFEERRLIVGEGDYLSLGWHVLMFITAPMVHWPEVIMTYDRTEKLLFSADAFGRFGTAESGEAWLPEARRYYFAIVGKYGSQVTALLKKAEALELHTICPLHGAVLGGELCRYLMLYKIWASYEAEADGVVIAYTSVYGNTKLAAELLSRKLKAYGEPAVVLYDLARADMTEAIADAFRYDRLVLATTTYNGEVFPFMREFIGGLIERGYRDRTVGLMENGSWAPFAARMMKKMLADSVNLTFLVEEVHIRSALCEQSMREIELLAQALSRPHEV